MFSPLLHHAGEVTAAAVEVVVGDRLHHLLVSVAHLAHAGVDVRAPVAGVFDDDVEHAAR